MNAAIAHAPTGLALLASNVIFFQRALIQLKESQFRCLYVSPHSAMMQSKGPAEYWVGCYTRNTPLAHIIDDLEAHLVGRDVREYFRRARGR